MRKNKALLLDRDGVVNIDHGYIGTIDRFTFMPGLFPFLRTAQDSGYRLAILTNQAGVARGKYSEDDFAHLTKHIHAELAREAIAIDMTLSCFAHPEGSIAPHNRESFWRKPNPGMVLEAIRLMRLDPTRCIFLGDARRDMGAAQTGGIGKCLWLTQETPPQGVIQVTGFDEARTHL